jgi:hypothetical protein
MGKKVVKNSSRTKPANSQKASAPDELPPEKQVIQSPPEPPEDESFEKKGIWEVSYESGAIIGYFEGTPKHIAAFIVNTDDEGKFIRKLNFIGIPVRRLPEKLMRTLCCGRSYSKNDNFCSRCGKGLVISTKLPAKFRLVINE